METTLQAPAVEIADSDSEESYLNVKKVIEQLELAPGMVVGDFGVGGSAHMALLMSRIVGDEGLVFMFDILKPAVSAALSMAKVQGATNCKGVWCNLELYGAAKGVKDETIDAGVVVNLLHQSRQYKDMLAEIYRMLKTGARLLIVDWKPDAEAPLAPPVEIRLPPERIEQVSKSLGYAPVKRFEASQYHWGLVVAKT